MLILIANNTLANGTIVATILASFLGIDSFSTKLSLTKVLTYHNFFLHKINIKGQRVFEVCQLHLEGAPQAHYVKRI